MAQPFRVPLHNPPVRLPEPLKQLVFNGMRLIHTADWQLGKPFGRFETEVRSALTEARFDAIDAIGRLAAEQEV